MTKAGQQGQESRAIPQALKEIIERKSNEFGEHSRRAAELRADLNGLVEVAREVCDAPSGKWVLADLETGFVHAPTKENSTE